MYLIKALIMFIACSAGVLEAQKSILIKFHLQSNEQFTRILDSYISLLSGKHHVDFYITHDGNKTYVAQTLQAIEDRYPNYVRCDKQGYSHYVEGINSNIKQIIDEYDIVVIGSEYQGPCLHNYDDHIVNEMMKVFPACDGVLFFHPEPVSPQANQNAVIGTKFLEEFGYVYHPSYTTDFAAQELTAVTRILKKEADVFKSLLTQNHQHNPIDTNDVLTFEKRRACYYDLSQERMQSVCTKVLSILIPTLVNRKHFFDKIYTKLSEQIRRCNLQDKVEILVFLDNKENSIGFKRNHLLHQSSGLYVVYVDDDDDVHTNYIQMLYDRLVKNPDSVNLIGHLHIKGRVQPVTFIHSVKYKAVFENNGVKFRPPSHINPIKRSIAVQFLFPDWYAAEDGDWSAQICRSNLIKYEEEIHEPYYFYYYVPDKKY